MSRHEFKQPGVNIAIGWDAPLGTFYLQIWTEALVTAEMDEDERDSPQIWLGTDYGEHDDPGLLLRLARRHYPQLPEDLEDTLWREKEQAPARPLPANHDDMLRLFTDLMRAER